MQRHGHRLCQLLAAVQPFHLTGRPELLERQLGDGADLARHAAYSSRERADCASRHSSAAVWIAGVCGFNPAARHSVTSPARMLPERRTSSQSPTRQRGPSPTTRGFASPPVPCRKRAAGFPGARRATHGDARVVGRDFKAADGRRVAGDGEEQADRLAIAAWQRHRETANRPFRFGRMIIRPVSSRPRR